MLSNISGILFSLLILTSFSFLFIFTGSKIFYSLNQSNSKNLNLHLAIGSSYFLGICFFIFIWRSLDFLLTNAVITLFLTVFISLIVFFKSFMEDFNSFKKFIFNIKFISILIVTFLLVFLFWMQKNDGFYIFTYLGSLHTGDYALISEYLINNNFIPSVRRNIAQVLLGSLTLIFGHGNIIFPLYFFLSLSVSFMAIFLWGVLIYLNLNKKNIFLYFLILSFGSFSLSLTRILVVDAGNPLLMYGYTDTMLANWVVIFLFFIFYKFFQNENKLSYLNIFFLLVILASNGMYGAQNLLLLLPFLFFIFIFKRKEINQVNFLIISGLVILGIIFSFTCGGLLTLGFFEHNTGLGNLDSTHSLTQRIEMTDQLPLTPVPTFWHFGLHSNGNMISNPYTYTLFTIYNMGGWLPETFNLKTFFYFIIHLFLVNEVLIFNVLRLSFWPIIGSLVLFSIVKFNLIKNENLNLKLFVNYNLTFLFIGLFITHFFSYYGMKWELSRFHMPGMLLGMLSLVIVFNYLFSFNSRKLNIFLYFIIFTIVVGGPSHLILMILERSYLFIFKENYLWECLRLFFTHRYLPI